MYDSEQSEQQNINASKPFNEALEIKKRTEFSHREVGLTHPDNNAFLRITDNGCIEIFAAPGIGLIMNPNTRSISFYSDSIKFFSKEDDGLRWNEKSFNPAADVYNEPALIKTSSFSNNPAYHRVSHYLHNIQEFEQSQSKKSTTITGRYALRTDSDNGPGLEDIAGFSIEQSNLIDSYSMSHTGEEVELLKSFILSGYSYDESVLKIQNKDLNTSTSSENFSWAKNDLDK